MTHFENFRFFQRSLVSIEQGAKTGKADVEENRTSQSGHGSTSRSALAAFAGSVQAWLKLKFQALYKMPSFDVWKNNRMLYNLYKLYNIL